MIRLAIIPIGKSRLRVFRFFGRGRDGIEADEGEKDNRGAAHHAAKTSRHKRVPVCRIDHEGAKGDNENHDRELDDDDGRVGGRALANAVNQEHRDRHDDEKRGQVKGDRMAHDDGQRGGRIIAQRRPALGDDGAGGGVIAHQPKRKLEVQPEGRLPRSCTKYPTTRRPPPCCRPRTQDQIPANDPGDDLAQSRVGVSVGRAGNRDHRRQLAVTERRETAGDGRDDKRKRHCRTRGGPPENKVGVVDVSDDEIEHRRFHDRLPDARRLACGRGAGERENSRADDRADAEAGEIERGERALHFALGRFRFVDQQLRTFGFEQLRSHNPLGISFRTGMVNLLFPPDIPPLALAGAA